MLELPKLSSWEGIENYWQIETDHVAEKVYRREAYQHFAQDQEITLCTHDTISMSNYYYYYYYKSTDYSDASLKLQGRTLHIRCKDVSKNDTVGALQILLCDLIISRFKPPTFSLNWLNFDVLCFKLYDFMICNDPLCLWATVSASLLVFLSCSCTGTFVTCCFVSK